ncbi:salivary glue protein Sgs-3-like [Mytilus californianus]|uniref:salivary glue protein Sgs-3-like n=1 Tax=Mytilus californianus TaxID=6549 RepID=UPI0022485C76|nr:salivary glue protein Sgs-3-like [Mytilus californianus]
MSITSKPTTVGPTVAESTTIQQTTVQPTTVQPTTVQPTTVQQTTVQATTIQPTTMQPTTVQPTTIKPSTTSIPTTAVVTVVSTWNGTSGPQLASLPTQPTCIDHDPRCSQFQINICSSSVSQNFVISTCPKSCNKCAEYLAATTPTPSAATTPTPSTCNTCGDIRDQCNSGIKPPSSTLLSKTTG